MNRKTDQPPPRWRIATGLRRDTRATDLVFWWRWLVSLPFLFFLTFSSHMSVCWCAVLGTLLLASPLPSGDLQCGEYARFFFSKRWTLLTLHRTLEFVDPRERAQSPVPLCAPPGFQAHGHACARCGAWLCSCLDRWESADVHCKLCGSKLCFHASVCALADTACGSTTAKGSIPCFKNRASRGGDRSEFPAALVPVSCACPRY